MSNKIFIGLVDDHTLFRQGIKTLCNSFDNMSVILEARNGIELLEKLKSATEFPDLLLLDLEMPDMDGIETLKNIKDHYSNIKTIVLSIHNEERFILHLIQNGANAYLFKDCETDELEKAIRSVNNEGYYFPQVILKTMQNNALKTKHRISTSNPFVDLTEREREILTLICQEYTTAEIAEKLFISARTAEGHRNNLLLKTSSKNTAGLVIFAIKHNLYLPKL
jgi:DNA-binding NarL/FixJ family response regulator